MAEANQRRYQRLRAEGKCVTCTTVVEEARKGRAYCVSCALKAKKRTALWMRIPGAVDRKRAAEQARLARLKAEGKCARCLGPIGDDRIGLRYCRPCCLKGREDSKLRMADPKVRKRHNTRNARYRRRLINEGKCARCQKVIEPERINKRHCISCAAAVNEREKARKFTPEQKARIEQQRQERRDKLLKDGKCVRCQAKKDEERLNKRLCGRCCKRQTQAAKQSKQWIFKEINHGKN